MIRVVLTGPSKDGPRLWVWEVFTHGYVWAAGVADDLPGAVAESLKATAAYEATQTPNGEPPEHNGPHFAPWQGKP